jgi:hypothetical protein
MKKLLIIAAVLAAMSLAFVACGGDDDSGETPPKGPRTVDLGTTFTAENNASQKGWGTNGTDNKETDLDIADLIAAKYLVLEMPAAPSGGFQLIWQGNAVAWTDWNQQNSVLLDDGTPDPEKGASVTVDGGKAILKIELSKGFVKYDTEFKLCTQAKFFIAYYSPNVDALGITKAYLEMAE